jgi:transcriptional regulator with XRE-family HTH domain
MTNVDSEIGRDVSVTEAVARNVREARLERGWTLDQLANRSGVSKGMVVQIEQAKTNPSIGTLSKIADALGVSLPDLVDAGGTPSLRLVESDDAALLWHSSAGSMAKLLVGGRRPDFIELWEWTLVPGDVYEGRAHPIGIRELIHVVEGTLTLTLGDEQWVLEGGTSAAYSGDQPHTYRNDDASALRMFLVMVDPSGGRER